VLLPAIPVQIGTEIVALVSLFKLLGVILDQGLYFKLHISRAATKGISAALAL
jgi:hypothetical protein